MNKVRLLLLMFASTMLLGCNNAREKRSSDLMTMRDSVRNDSARNDVLVDDEFALQNTFRMENNETYPYRIKLIHEHLDSFLMGEIKDKNLEPYRDIIERKFYILDVHCVMAGTMYFKIIFPKHPHAEFVAATGIDVDDNDSITAYHLFEIKRKGK